MKWGFGDRVVARAGLLLRPLPRVGPGNEFVFKPGNTLSTTHGARSEVQIAPVRAELDAEFAAAYPDLTPARRALLADRAARVVMVRRFLDQKGDIFADRALGEPWPVLSKLQAWENSVDQTLRELEERRRERSEPGLEQLTATGRKIREAREGGEAR